MKSPFSKAPQPPLTDILAAINQAENGDTAFLIAASINLYSEALRRKTGRVLYTPADAENLFTICNMLLHPPMDAIERPRAAAKPTPDEMRSVETAGAEGESAIPFSQLQ